MDRAPSPPLPTPPWHVLSATEALDAVGSGADGLTDQEAAQRLQRDGPNALPESQTRGPVAIFLAQFADFMIGVLLVAAGIAFAIGEGIEAGAILAIVVLNAILGFVQEWRAEQAMAALRSLAAPHAQVIRAQLAQKWPRRPSLSATSCGWRRAQRCRPTSASSSPRRCGSTKRR